MYNMVVGDQHPSTICVDLYNLSKSLDALLELMNSQYVNEELMDFIETYSRKDEVKPDDRTVGFIVVNAPKRVISISMNRIPADLRQSIEGISEKFRSSNIQVELDIS